MQRKASDLPFLQKTSSQRILTYLFEHRTASKTELVHQLGLSLPTVLQCMKQLVEGGYVLREGKSESTGGRKAQIFTLNNDARNALGLDITKNHVSFVVIGMQGKLTHHIRLQIPFRATAEYLQSVAEEALTLLDGWQIPLSRIVGGGISVPGILDRSNTRVVRSHALGVEDFDLSALLACFPFPCVCLNDANAAGLAERVGDSNGEDMVYLSLSNTVGGAIFLLRRIYLGENLRSGEFGHMMLEPGGLPCYCGKEGCLDSYCSALVLSRPYGGRLEGFFGALDRGAPEAVSAWQTYVRYLALACNNLRMAFDCRVVIGGYVGAWLEPYIEQVREEASHLNTFEESGAYLSACRYKTEAAAFGAALQHMHSEMMNFVLEAPSQE